MEIFLHLSSSRITLFTSRSHDEGKDAHGTFSNGARIDDDITSRVDIQAIEISLVCSIKRSRWRLVDRARETLTWSLWSGYNLKGQLSSGLCDRCSFVQLLTRIEIEAFIHGPDVYSGEWWMRFVVVIVIGDVARNYCAGTSISLDTVSQPFGTRYQIVLGNITRLFPLYEWIKILLSSLRW